MRSNTCYSSANEVLKQSITNETIDPKLIVKVHIELNRNGMSSMMNSYTSKDFDEKKFQEYMARWQEKLEKELESITGEYDSLYV